MRRRLLPLLALVACAEPSRPAMVPVPSVEVAPVAAPAQVPPVVTAPVNEASPACVDARAALAQARDAARAALGTVGVDEAAALSRAQAAFAGCETDPECVADPKVRAARLMAIKAAEEASVRAQGVTGAADVAVFGAQQAADRACGPKGGPR